MSAALSPPALANVDALQRLGDRIVPATSGATMILVERHRAGLAS